MDTIRRLGEQETLDRIINGTLKSYVDHDIDSVDTSQFLNLETLNVPKAQSVLIGEGVKDTIEVINAPKVEEVSTFNTLTVNWGKCGGSSDVIRTYKEGGPITIPVAFFTEHMIASRDGFDTNTVDGRKLGGVGYLYNYSAGALAVYRLPQNIGKWLYENAESATGPMNPFGGTTYRPFYRGIGTYSDGVLGHEGSDDTGGWGIGIRTYDDINIRDQYNWTGIEERTVSVRNSNFLRSGEYYAIIQYGGGITTMTSCLKIHEELGLTDLECKRWLDMTSLPSSTNKGTKYTYPSTNTLSNLLNLKVADVHSMDVDVPMFEGCTNLERVIVGGKTPSSISVNWGKCGGSSDVIVTYNEGDPLWIPKAFMTNTSSYALKNYHSGGANYKLRIYTLPKKLGAYLYEVAESNTTDISDYTLNDTSNSTNSLFHNYKGIAIYSDNPSSWTSSKEWGVGIRKKSDMGVDGHINGVIHKCDLASSLESDPYFNDEDFYMVLQDYNSEATTYITNLSASTVDDGTPTSDHIYFRTYRELTDVPSASNMGTKYTFTPELYIPTLNSSYFEGCNNLKDVIITNPELRVGDAIPSELISQINLYADESKVLVKEQPLVVNWGKCGGTDDVIVTYDMGDPIHIPKGFLTQAYTSTSSGCTPNTDNLDTSIGYKTWFGSGDCDNGTRTSRVSLNTTFYTIYKLPQNLGEYLHKSAENYNGTSYTGTSIGTNNAIRIYKGIAIYSDTVTSWSGKNNLHHPKHWGIGIRKKNELKYIGLASDFKTPTTDGGGGMNNCGGIDNLPEIKALEDDAYYLIAQCENRAESDNWIAWGMNYWIEQFGTGNIYFRHWCDMTSTPSATNLGKKYTVPVELCRPQKNVYYSKTKKAQMVVNWGNLGGVTTFKEGDDLYLPHAFMYDAFSSITTNSDTLKSNLTSAPSSDYVGYVGKCVSKSASRYLLVYKLPNEYGKHLYDIAKSGIARFWAGYGDGGFYKGIFCVPTAEENITAGQSISGNYGIGIRKKSDVWQYTGGGDSISEDSTLKALLDDNSYYMVVDYMSNDCYVPLLRKYSNNTDDFYLYDYTTIPAGSSSSYVYTLDHDTSVYRMDGLPSLQITMAEYLKENNPNYDFIPR